MKPRNAFISLTLVFLIGVGIYGYQQEIFPFQTDTVAVTSSDQTNSVENSSEEEVWSNDYSVVNIGDLTKEMVGRKVTVVGSAGKISRTSSGHTFVTLQDATGQIEIPVFSNLDIDTSNLKEGDKLEVRGKVDLYEDELQVIPNSIGDVSLNADSAKKEQSSTGKGISSITKSQLGEVLEVKGVVSNYFLSDKGNVFVDLSDDTGGIRVVLFYDSDQDYKNAVGVLEDAASRQKSVTLEGKVNEYKGDLQLILQKVR